MGLVRISPLYHNPVLNKQNVCKKWDMACMQILKGALLPVAYMVPIVSLRNMKILVRVGWYDKTGDEMFDR